jgi:hypothetical protein
MKKLLFAIAVLCISSSLKSQQLSDDSNNLKNTFIPSSVTSSTENIANYIKINFKTDQEKLLAIYSWVTKNIKYDQDSMFAINWNTDKQSRITEAMRRGKGVCENYAAIFTDIANKAGFESYVVNGYTKKNAVIDRIGHAWCVIQLNNEWYCCDPTWDKDEKENFHYFLLSPEDFIATHMPFDPMWQLLHQPLTHIEFRKGIFAADNKNYYHFEDSIKANNHLSELKQLQASSKRMSDAGPVNELMNNRLAYINMEIALIYEDRDMHLYNDAVAMLNNATRMYNTFIQAKNNTGLQMATDAELNKRLAGINYNLRSAYQKIKGLSKFNQQFDPSELKERLDDMSKKVKAQAQTISIAVKEK